MEEVEGGEGRATLSHGRVGRCERRVTEGRTRERRRTSQSRGEAWGGGRGCLPELGDPRGGLERQLFRGDDGADSGAHGGGVVEGKGGVTGREVGEGGGDVGGVVDPGGDFGVEGQIEGVVGGSKVIGKGVVLELWLYVVVVVPGETEGVGVV